MVTRRTVWWFSVGVTLAVLLSLSDACVGHAQACTDGRQAPQCTTTTKATTTKATTTTTRTATTTTARVIDLSGDVIELPEAGGLSARSTTTSIAVGNPASSVTTPAVVQSGAARAVDATPRFAG